jgi:hypothetical protein
MSLHSPSFLLGAALMLLSMIAGVGGAAWLARSMRRRDRENRRHSVSELTRELRAFLRGRRTAAAVANLANAAEAGAFWAALETLGAAGRDRRALSRALLRSTHLADERRALRDDSPWRRELAARRLGLLRSEISKRALRRALARGPALVTLAAATALARDRDGAALRWLIAHPQALARRTPRALVGLLRAFGPGARRLLIEALEAGRLDPALERAAIETLGLSGDRAACAVIERRLQSRDLELRIGAARALGRLRDRESVPALLALLADPEWQARAHAARALGQMRDLETVDALAERLTDRAWWVRRHAAYALERLGPRGRTALHWAARHSPDPYARDMASEVLEGGFGRAAGA